MSVVARRAYAFLNAWTKCILAPFWKGPSLCYKNDVNLRRIDKKRLQFTICVDKIEGNTVEALLATTVVSDQL